jgi:predicted nucleic-acid-binding protein
MITKNNEVNMKEYLILELKRLLKKDIEYSRSDIQKVLNNIKELDEIQLSLYSKVRSKDNSKDIIKEYYEKKISLNK